MRKKFYITTAIPYVNSPPHIGFALEIIQTDAIARYHRLLGEEVFFLTGTDENSLKNVRAAEKEGISPKELVDRNAKNFYNLKKILNLSFDDFIRTTEERHYKGAQKLWLLCQKDIYKKKYRGLYCLGCEEFYKKDELVNGLCPEHKTKPELIEEENYFFRLSKYQEKIRKIIKEDKVKIIPKFRKNEVLNFINKGLEDICVSRDTKRARGWGITVPGDPSQTIWVWFDALSNYINALGFAQNLKKFKKWWPADLHVIGKGVLRFHSIYWLGILLSAKLPLPKAILVHGYVTVAGEKVSKSLGNVISPVELVKRYGSDPIRYFLLREGSPFEDIDFTIEKFEKRYNDDLAKGLGNLVARIVALLKKESVENKGLEGEVKETIEETWRRYERDWKDFKFNEALGRIWELIAFCDKYIEREKPWELIKSQPEKGKKVIGNLVLVLENIAKMLTPFLPDTSQKILGQLKTKKKEILFPPLK